MSDIPEGYRMSEVGVIPEEWDVEKIKNISYITTGAKNTQDKIDDGEYPFFVRSSTVERINSYSFDGEAVLTAGDGVGTGKVIHYVNGKFDFHQRVYKISDFNEKIDGYFFYLLFRNYFLKRIMSMTAKSSVDSVRMEMIAEMPIPLPPLSEQQAIASALSDVDALITALEQLITKKRNIKQGAMQQLLTGKKRLPGFDGEWEVKKLGQIAEIATGNTPPTNDLNNYGDEFLFVSPADLGRSKYIIDTGKKLSKKGFNMSRKFPMNSIIFTCIGSTIGKSGIAPIGLTSNQQINAIYPNDSYSTDYIFYTLNNLAYRIKSSASEQAVPIINKSTFKAIQIPLPPLPEQTAIAQILSDMDTEIEALEQKQAKYKAIKQGMMQELLTGKTRLV